MGDTCDQGSQLRPHIVWFGEAVPMIEYVIPYVESADKLLVIGSSGQIGTELVLELRKIYGEKNVIASDIRSTSKKTLQNGPFELLDVMDEKKLFQIVKKHKITQVYFCF